MLDSRVFEGEPVEIEQTRPVNQARINFLDAREPIVDGAGQVIGLSGLARDITDRRAEGPSFLQPGTDLPSPGARWTIARASLAANSDECVLILGEMGSGNCCGVVEIALIGTISKFDGGNITSDAGCLLLRETERQTRILKGFAGCFEDLRNSKMIEHPVGELIAQRVYGLALCLRFCQKRAN